MKVDVVVNGRVWTVGVEPAERPGSFAVTTNGMGRVVDASWIDADTLSLVDAGSSHEIRFHPRADTGAVGAEIRGRLFEVAKRTKRGQVGSSGSAAGTAAPDPVSVKAPMPGRVARVLVSLGERVTARQAVVVVEAMKMENELRTPRDGTVKEIAAAPGAAVEAGAVLVVIGD